MVDLPEWRRSGVESQAIGATAGAPGWAPVSGFSRLSAEIIQPRGPNSSQKKFPKCVSTIRWLIYIYFLPALNCFCTLLISPLILLTVGSGEAQTKVPSREDCPSGLAPTCAR